MSILLILSQVEYVGVSHAVVDLVFCSRLRIAVFVFLFRLFHLEDGKFDLKDLWASLNTGRDQMDSISYTYGTVKRSTLLEESRQRCVESCCGRGHI